MISEVKIPDHLGIILDGNRRWAKEHGLNSVEGHMAGYKTVNNLLDWVFELGVKELTLYCFSIQNFNRTKEEVKALFSLFEKALTEMMVSKRLERDQIRVAIVGKVSLLPKGLRALAKKLEQKTKGYKNKVINLAIAYGGREEIIDAVRKIAKDVEAGKISPKNIDNKTIEKHLYLNSCPDLIIRTSGERRTSNFLLWQSYYSEWKFLEKNWPDFKKSDLKKAIEDYSNRQRRFGK